MCPVNTGSHPLKATKNRIYAKQFSSSYKILSRRRKIKIKRKTIATRYALKRKHKKKKKTREAITKLFALNANTIKQAEKQKKIALIEEDIGRINERIELLDNKVSLLDNEFILLVEKSAKDNNMSLISKANARKRKSSKRKKELADLENSLKVAREKHRKLV